MPILFSGLHSPPPTRPPTLLCSSTWQRELPCILRLPLWRTLHVASVIPNSTFRFYSQLLNISWNCKRSFFLDEFRPDFFFFFMPPHWREPRLEALWFWVVPIPVNVSCQEVYSNDGSDQMSKVKVTATPHNPRINFQSISHAFQIGWI